MATTNVLIAGVGGQGAVLASEMLALAALAAGQDVKQGEFHGVAQRGGSVFSHVRFGPRVYSPTARLRSVDYLVSLEKLEALRYAHFVRPGATIILNRHEIEPIRTADQRPYPENVDAFLEQRGFAVDRIDATATAIELGNHRVANVVLLGRLSTYLQLPESAWQTVLHDRIPERFRAINFAAFAAGRVTATPARGNVD